MSWVLAVSYVVTITQNQFRISQQLGFYQGVASASEFFAFCCGQSEVFISEISGDRCCLCWEFFQCEGLEGQQKTLKFEDW